MTKLRQVFFGLLCVGIASVTWGQNTTGTILGRVADPTGAAVPNVQISILLVATGETRQATTNEQGDFNIELLEPGDYTITASAVGFKKAVQAGIILQVDRTVRADFILQLGAATETVTISSSALTLDTDSSQVGETITEQQVVQLPLNGREFTDLLFLTPGAVQQVSEQNQFRYNVGGAISLEGARSGSNGYTVDGTSIMDYGWDTPAYQVSLDAIEEFNVQTATYSAQYGYSANQVNMSSKPGTNEFHGSAFEYIRNNVLDAKNFFLASTQPLRQNQFGYSFGGPLWIPKIYNGRNKTFFFANYEGERIRSTAVESGIVPTTAEVGGVFPFPVYDPLTGDPFPNNTIPAGRISRFGQLVESNPTLWFPTPNQSGLVNFVAGVSAPVNNDQQNYRIDQQLGSKDSIFFRAAKSDILAVIPGGLAPVSEVNTIQRARNYTLAGTHIFTPTLLDQLRIGYMEPQVLRDPYNISAADKTALSLQNALNLANGGYPEIQWSTYSNPTLRPNIVNATTAYSGTGGANNTPTGSLEAMWDIEDSVSWTKGAQAISTGFGMRRVMYQIINAVNPLGIFTFDGEFSGNQISDMLLGNPQRLLVPQAGPTGNAQTGPNPHMKFATYSPYIQDDWKLTRRLTINAGLRYEFNAVPYEEGNSLFWRDPSVPGGGVYVADQRNVQYGNGWYVYNGMRGPGPAPKNDFAPRVGFSYRPFNNDKTVVRGGYGLFFDTYQMEEWAVSTGFFPAYSEYTPSATYGINLLNLNNMYPTPPPAGSVTPASMPVGPLAEPNFQNPYIEDFTFGVQREIVKDTIIDVSYEGSHGVHQATRLMLNQPTECIPSLGCDPDTTSPGYIPVSARSPLPNFGSYLIDDTWIGFSKYNSLNAKVEHRTKDLQLLATYTWSKGMDIKSSTAAINGDVAGWIGIQNNHDPLGDYARSDYDIGQRLAVSFVAAVPVGRGQKLAGSVNRAADAVIGGWQIMGIGVFQGGFPTSITATDIGFINEAYGERANQVGNPYPSGFKKGLAPWFNPAAFAQPAPGYFGNSSRNVIRVPGPEVISLTAAKSFPLGDRVKLQFRFESFNVLNHPQFGAPDVGVNDSTFGQIHGLAGSENDDRVNQGALRVTF